MDTFPCQLNSNQHCALRLSVWKRHVTGKLVFTFQKPLGFLAHSVYVACGRNVTQNRIHSTVNKDDRDEKGISNTGKEKRIT
jgi:hypothetical protein